ncbi:hypothetical protein KUCAC02_014806 [Chaenocephalus aceratus]|uniref:Uncharacterized protein n=1 Tax=Chaenocephalus aceratus TaxID=36190 RepID=A0ACB9WEY8_CHAAC|nr:hypothetical protein KUCAC02_014806 [Chaenocephalus aceratus]
MEQWQNEASQQVKLLTTRLNELLSKGLGLLRSELGVDLGLKPELIPPWVILLAACSGLLLLVALWASTCRSLFKKRPDVSPLDDGFELKRDESKPKSQPNGRAVAESQEEAIESEEIVPHHQTPPPESKAEKAAELKKSKKKAKQAVKETKSVTAARKEPEEGTWETKVSNKEKREQRKKDKGSSDGSNSPGGGHTPGSASPEQPKASAAPPPASQTKTKGESAKVKVEKVEAVVPAVNSEAVAAVTDMAVKVPAPTVSPKARPWTTTTEPASVWRAELDESWTVIDRGMAPAEPHLVSLSSLGVGTAEPEPVKELPCLSPPRVDDEWSGLNGGSVDSSSDWNAPAEVWGNYEEKTPEPPPIVEQPLPEPSKVDLLMAAADDDEDEKDKGETAGDGAAKTKKKKKKKKKAAEEEGTAGQGEEPEKEALPAASMKKQESAAAVQPVKAAAVEVRVEQPPTEGETTAKQKGLSAPTQQNKPEESQAPKPAKKKKARRET